MQVCCLLVLASSIAACAYTAEVGTTGDVGFTHERLAAGKHLLSITAAPGLMETESSIEQRIHVFAIKHAAKTCPASFDFLHDPNFSQSMSRGFMNRTKTYVFVCKGG